MKLIVNEDPSCTETEVVIRCARQDISVQRLLAALQALNALDVQLICRDQEEIVRLACHQILYIEAVDHKTFVYTDDRVCESDLRLYQLEQKLQGRSFFRASKSCLINLERVRSLRPELGARLLLTMENGEKILVSRQYASAIKQTLEVT